MYDPGGHLRAYVGVFSGYDVRGPPDHEYSKRRRAIRDTWMSHNEEDLELLERQLGVRIRFVLGRPANTSSWAAGAARDEFEEHRDVLRLHVVESYTSLVRKAVEFFRALSLREAPDADWYIKADDDVYLMPKRLLLAMEQWDRMGAGYVGCMVQRGKVERDPSHRWYEPQHHLVPHGLLPTYAMGSLYAVRGDLMRLLFTSGVADHLRHLANEDTTIGLWMLALNATHFFDRRLCPKVCLEASVAVLSQGCTGLCRPVEDMYACHRDPACQADVQAPLPYLKSKVPHYDSMWV